MPKEDHQYHRPTAEGMAKIEKLRAKVIELDALVDELIPSTDRGPAGRCRSIAHTKLEEFRQRAIEGIVRLHNDGAVEPKGGDSNGDQVQKGEGQKAG